MGRAEKRKQKKALSRRLTPEQFAKLNSDANREMVKYEVDKQIEFYQALWTECMLEAFKQNNISTEKVRIILEDIETIMLRKVSEKKNGSTK